MKNPNKSNQRRSIYLTFNSYTGKYAWQFTKKWDRSKSQTLVFLYLNNKREEWLDTESQLPFENCPGENWLSISTDIIITHSKQDNTKEILTPFHAKFLFGVDINAGLSLENETLSLLLLLQQHSAIHLNYSSWNTRTYILHEHFNCQTFSMQICLKSWERKLKRDYEIHTNESFQNSILDQKKKPNKD